jgi:hypothetical protein
MSNYQAEFMLNWPLSDGLQLCRSAVQAIGWRITAQQSNTLTVLQTPQGMSFGSPVTVQITLAEADSGSTRLTLNGSNFGLGPIQSGHVKSQVQLLRQSIEQAATQPPQSSGTFTRSVIVNEERVSDETLQALERRYGLRIDDGSYSYDSASGAWGQHGQPTMGFVLPGLNLGGLLRADASNGNTGVFINGRQLHTLDMLRLQQLVGQVWPGRWWVDARGNFGPEGGPLLGNLWMVAQLRSAPSGGSSRTSSVSGVTVGGEGGFLYAQGRDALGNPFSTWSS